MHQSVNTAWFNEWNSKNSRLTRDPTYPRLRPHDEGFEDSRL